MIQGGSQKVIPSSIQGLANVGKRQAATGIKQEQKAEADLNRLKEKGRLAENGASDSSSNEEDSASAAEETEIV